MTLRCARDSAHDFIMKFSPSMCVATICGEVEKWLHKVLLTLLMEQQTLTNPAVINGLCAMTKH